MEGSVSNVDICNLAYMGQFEKVRQSALSDKSLICKTDQVRFHTLVGHIVSGLLFIIFNINEAVGSRTAAPPCTGPVLPATPTSRTSCSTWGPRWTWRMMCVCLFVCLSVCVRLDIGRRKKKNYVMFTQKSWKWIIVILISGSLRSVISGRPGKWLDVNTQ